MSARPGIAHESLVDLDRLREWMDGAGLGQGPLSAVTPLAGGTQNVLLRFQRDGRGYVLRRPPRHPRADGSKTMLREAQVLAALKGSAVPHPGLIAVCEDRSVLGAAFYLMEPVDGYNPTTGLPDDVAASPSRQHALGLSMVDALLALRAVDWQAAGLQTLGKPEGYLERQVPRWLAWYEAYAEYEGWKPEVPHLHTVARWLDDHRPAQFVPGIMHGDFHLANVMFRHDAPALAAIVDWELVTVGDPLIDLGWLLATWPDPDGMGAGTIEVHPWNGFPSERELAAAYVARSGRPLPNLDWYTVFGCYKLGILMEGSWARACAGQAPHDIGERLHASTVRLLGRAVDRIRQAGG
ncbi:MAG: phosphotransferase family protein [Rubrivivax sp.]